nr:MAG: replication associated protein [Cressdnaviricota sp.]
MSFRLTAKIHFITYPQCNVPLEEILRQLKEKADDKYGWCVISAEDHEERVTDVTKHCGVHRHAMMEVTKVINIKDCKWWDITWEGKVYHPHVEAAKTKVKCLQYVIKDGEYIVDGTYKECPFTIDNYLEANKTKTAYGMTYIASELKKGKTIHDLNEVVPGHVLMHKRKIEDYTKLLEEKKQKLVALSRPPFPGFKMPHSEPWKKVVKWANKNFLEVREPRQKQLFLWSREPEMGKTFPWSNIMREYKTCYEWTYSGKQNAKLLEADYILIDELRGGITVGELKSLSQMYGMNLDLKYADITFWNKNIPLIVTSNRPPREIYHKCSTEDIESLESRFLIVEVQVACHLKVKKPPTVLYPPEEVLVPATPDPLEDKQDMEDERIEDEHSEYSNEEYSKKEWMKKHSKNLIRKD